MLQKQKVEEKLKDLQRENNELRELLSDKEQLTDMIEFLIDENKRYRKEQEEMQGLLEAAKNTAAGSYIYIYIYISLII